MEGTLVGEKASYQIKHVFDNFSNDVDTALQNAKSAIQKLLSGADSHSTDTNKAGINSVPLTPSACKSASKHVRFASGMGQVSTPSRRTSDRGWQMQILSATKERLLQKLRSYADNEHSLAESDLMHIQSLRTDINLVTEAIQRLRHHERLDSADRKDTSYVLQTPQTGSSEADNAAKHGNSEQSPVFPRGKTLHFDNSPPHHEMHWSEVNKQSTPFQTPQEPTYIGSAGTRTSVSDPASVSSRGGADGLSESNPEAEKCTPLFERTTTNRLTFESAEPMNHNIDPKVRELLKSVGCDDVLDWDVSREDSLQVYSFTIPPSAQSVAASTQPVACEVRELAVATLPEALSPLSDSSVVLDEDHDMFLSASSSTSSEGGSLPVSPGHQQNVRHSASPDQITPIRSTERSLIFIDEQLDLALSPKTKDSQVASGAQPVARRLFSDKSNTSTNAPAPSKPYSSGISRALSASKSAVKTIAEGKDASPLSSKAVGCKSAHACPISPASKIPVPRCSPGIGSQRKHRTDGSVCAALPSNNENNLYDPARYSPPEKTAPPSPETAVSKPPFVLPSPDRVLSMVQELTASAKRAIRAQRKMKQGPVSPAPVGTALLAASNKQLLVGTLRSSPVKTPSRSTPQMSSPLSTPRMHSPTSTPKHARVSGIASTERRRNIGILSPSPSK